MTSVPSSPSMASVFSGSSRPTKALVQESIREGKPLSVVSPGCMEKAGEGLPRRHPLVGDKELVSLYDDDVTTLYEAFEKSANVFATRPFFGTRERLEDGQFGSYQWLSYAQVKDKTQHFASGLAHLGLKAGDNVGIFSINRMEWLLTSQAVVTLSVVSVPLYDTLGEESIIHICNQAELSTIVATADKAMLLCTMKSSIGSLQRVIVMDAISEDLRKLAKSANVELVLFASVEEKGRNEPMPNRPPAPSDVYTICYTSGSTGLPKGVVLSHAAMIAFLAGALIPSRLGQLVDFEPDDVYLSYLPLAHVLERVIVSLIVAVGASIGFYSGDTLKLSEDLAELKPTVFVSVPRLFNRIYDKVFADLKGRSGLAQFLFNTAYQSKLKGLRSGKLTHWFWDMLIFSKIRAKLGGRVKVMLTGSAPIGSEVMDFLRVAFSCEVFEGYGQTETCAGNCLTARYDCTTGNVGVPLPSNEAKLVDVPEMGYLSTNKPYPQGEICFRGPSMFSGYYKDAEKTAETVDSEGWVHTGDIGMWDELGRLKIIDRKKNIFKLSQGEYIAPEKIENMMTQCPMVENAFVHGNSLKSSLVAVIVPDKAQLEGWAKSEGIETTSFSELCRDAKAQAAVQDIVNKFLRSRRLKGFEVPKVVYLHDESFSVANDLLTSTFKLKRHVAIKTFHKQIEEMYKKLEH